jgi:diguanylate cyclase (GGDEF)-like protein/PAS domain S-box-containing protein
VAIVDITQARRAQAEVAATREFLNVVIENVPAPIIVKDAQSLRIALVNRATENFLGMKRSEILGRAAPEVFLSESAELIRERDQDLLRRPREVFHDEHRFETQGNGVRYASTRRMLVSGDKGEPKYLVSVFDDVTDRRLASERIAHLTSHDILTGLPNRTIFGERLADALDRAGPTGVAVFCIDLDRFKDVNDALGHALADRVLAIVGHRIQSAAGEAFVSRVGGDEFNVIMTNAEQPEAVATFAEILRSAVAGEIEIGEQHVKVAFSIGVAISPADGADAPALVANAEAALFRAKTGGRGIVCFFEAEMENRLRESRALANDLKSAIECGQLRLHYQPQADVTGRLLGFEALVRWQHPTRGLLPPGLFIPIAEEHGLIVEIGEWILREACREAASWPGDLSIAVNLSPIQFRQNDFFGLIHSVLVETGLPGRRLELEITEGVLIADTNAVLSVLRRAKALGARIAMDDFGTGYSSLYYLQSFPFDKIKIDRSFIANLGSSLQSAAIVRGVLGLAHGLNLPVIAEGVETEEQLAILVREGCDEIQGYIMGRPCPIEAYAGWILRNDEGPLQRGIASKETPSAVGDLKKRCETELAPLAVAAR